MAKRRTRADILADLDAKQRAHSTTTVLRHAAIAARVGLHTTDHKTVDLLLRQGPMPAGALAAATGLTTGAVTALIDRLENAGIVRRVADPNDRRKVMVEAVRGSRLEKELSALFAPSRELFRRAIASFTNEELEIIVDYLARSEAALRQSIDMLNAEKGGTSQ